MRNIVGSYVSRFLHERHMRTRMIEALAILAVLVTVLVFWQLHTTGVALANEVSCGMEEHVHTEECYTLELVCDNPEEDHVHTEDCYAQVLTCDLPEHTHTAACLSDDTADVETSEDWEATLPEDLTGVWSEDVVSIAVSQIGYTESTANFRLAEDGTTRQGYTRYGDWYGNPYGDWDAMFVAFCLHYAGVSEEDFPEASGAYAWAVELAHMDLYASASAYTPNPGDLVFLDENGDGTANRVGILSGVKDNKEKAPELSVIAGEDAEVREQDYNLNDPAILGYGILPQSPEQPVMQMSFSAKEQDVLSVSVSAPTGALPEKADLTVSLLEPDSEDYLLAAQQVGVDLAALEDGSLNLAVLDLSFRENEIELEPEASVEVTMDLSNLLPEDVDWETVVVTHLAETEEGILPETVATADEGLDPETGTVSFSLDSFSHFTIQWGVGDGDDVDTDTIEVHVYDMNGSGIQENLDAGYSHEDESIDIEDVVKHLEAAESLSDYGYTFEYATVVYQVSNGYGGYDTTVLGGLDDSVVSVSKKVETSTDSEGNETSTVTYTVELESDDSSEEYIKNPDVISIHLYYSIPTVTIEIGETSGNGSVTLTAEPEYFKGDEDYTYEWSLAEEDSGKGTLNYDRTSSTASFTWSDDTEIGTQVTINLEVTKGSDESAETSCTLTYGEVGVTITVDISDLLSGYSSVNGKVFVSLIDSEGNTVASGSARVDGTEESVVEVSLSVVPGEYTVGVTYLANATTSSSGGQGGPGGGQEGQGGGTVIVRCSGEKKIEVKQDENAAASLELDGEKAVTSKSGVSGSYTEKEEDSEEESKGEDYESWSSGDVPYYYEHIDVKASSAEVEGASQEFSELFSVTVYDKYGSLIYSSGSLNSNEGTNDYNCLFRIAGTSMDETHSIVVSSEDTIVIVYEVETTNADGTVTDETKSITITANENDLYPSDDYYDYTDTNAWKLFSILTGDTTYSDEYNKVYEENGKNEEAREKASEAAQAKFEEEWAEIVENLVTSGTYSGIINSRGILLDTLNYIQVADYLCDTRSLSNQAGLDFVIDVTPDELVAIPLLKYSTAVDHREAHNYVIIVSASDSEETDNFCLVLLDEDGNISYYADVTVPEDGSGNYIIKNWVEVEEGSSLEKDACFSVSEGTCTFYYSGELPEYSSICLYDNSEESRAEANVYQLLEGAEFQITRTITETDEYGNEVEVTQAALFLHIESTTDDSNAEESEKKNAALKSYNYYFMGWVDIANAGNYNGTLTTTLTSSSDGYLNIVRLDPGTYTITEINAPSGYVPIADSIEVTVSSDGSITYKINTEEDDKEATNGFVLVGNDVSAAKLPSTGGSGTILYTLGGALLLVCGAYSLVYTSKRRKGGAIH